MAKLSSPSLRVDKLLVVYVLISVLLGLWMVYSATAFRFDESGLDSTILNLIRGDFGKQLIGVVLGGCLAVILSSLDPESTWSNQKYVISLVLISFLMLILVQLFGHAAGGAKRWLSLPGFSLQPSELFKPITAILTAFLITRENRTLGDYQAKDWILVSKLVGFFIVPLALILNQPDLGTAIAITAVILGVLFHAGLHRNVFTALSASAIAVFTYWIVSTPFRFQRVKDWLTAIQDPLNINDPLGSGHQIKQALIAVGNGGVLGVGPGAGRQKLYFLPESHTDYIFAVIGEELGLIGSLFVVGLFLLIMSRCFKIISHANSPFLKSLALGLTLVLVVQALINISVVLSLVPSKGIPLPFISYGANSAISSLICIGMLLGISKRTQNRSLSQ
jgi:cell division protein FtsW